MSGLQQQVAALKSANAVGDRSLKIEAVSTKHATGLVLLYSLSSPCVLDASSEQKVEQML